MPPQTQKTKNKSFAVAIHQPEAFPWLGFFEKFYQTNLFVVLDHVQYEKNYFQNRNRIRTATTQGWSWLTIPVLTRGRSDQPIREVAIDNQTDWKRKHLSALWQHYHNAPGYCAFAPWLKAHYEKQWERLVDFNLSLIAQLSQHFQITTPVCRSSDLPVRGSRSELLLSICQAVGAKTYLSGISGRTYLDVPLFEKAGVAVEFQQFEHPVYTQQYHPFVPALSSLDLLFNHGPKAGPILRNKAAPRLRDVVFN